MSRRVDHKQLVTTKEVVPAPTVPGQGSCNDHSFELPARIYIGMGLMFFGFVAVLASTFRGNMAVSYGIVFAFLAAFFAVPAIFVKASPASGAKALNWSSFRDQGIATATGRTGASEATILVLALPFLILCFGVAVATIATFVH